MSDGILSSPAGATAKIGQLETRDRILDVAEALFAESGFAGTPVRDIARSVGLTPASLYNHFPGKAALYEAVLARGIRPLFEIMQARAAREFTTESMEEMIEAIMDHLGGRPHLPRLIQHEAISGGAHLSQIAREWIRPIIESGTAELKRDPNSVFDEAEYPFVMSAWLNLVFGYFALAPLLREVFDHEPLAADTLAAQTRFLRKLARLMNAPRSPDDV